MPPKKVITLRLSHAQARDVEAVSRKLHLDVTNVIRLAITRLAEQELAKPLPASRP